MFNTNSRQTPDSKHAIYCDKWKCIGRRRYIYIKCELAKQKKGV